jgi:UDP:flavonoid glycosyltransferase YjiC (YdhE family)
MPLPDWWSDLPTDRPIVYVSVGSSGTQGLLETTLRALDSLPVCGIVAAADRTAQSDVPDNVFVANYLPGSQVCSVASLFVGHGGSPYQPLEHGVPVLGVPFNIDQQLSMAGVESAGAGRALRAGQLTVENLRETMLDMLYDGDLYESAARIARRVEAWDLQTVFEGIVRGVLGLLEVDSPAPGRECTTRIEQSREQNHA